MFEKNLEKKLISLIISGKIFIYPTDTVYGIGCNANHKKAVAKIKKIKSRNKPLSIIVPTKVWLFKHLKGEKKIINKYLPGKYTLILKKKNKKFLSWVSKKNTLGIRVPKHDFQFLIKKAGVPFITTSANLSGKKPPARVIEINEQILKQADVIVNAGRLSGKPSTIINFNGKKLKR